MKLYIIAAALFATGLLTLGFLTASVISPPSPPHKAAAAAAKRPAGGGTAATAGPSAPVYPAAMPPQPGTPQSRNRSAGMRPAMPGMGSSLPGADLAPGDSRLPGVAGPIGISAPPAIPAPAVSPIQPTNPVPVIQPTDLGTAPTPTAGKEHQ